MAIGAEILLGEIVDTNSAWIARRLPALGIELHHTSVAGDDLERLTETLARARERSDLTITTGGLGPTEDDLTREAVCALLGEEPRVDTELERRLRAFFARRGYPMPEANVKQAWLIPSARALDNPRGTAPGWWTEREGRIVVSMPGVPPEMERMWLREVEPALEGRSGAVLVTRTIKTAGVGEGTVDELAKPLFATPGVGFGTYARADGVHVRLDAKAATAEEARRRLEPVERELDAIFGDAVWGRDGDTLEGVVADALRARGQTIAALEWATGGLLAGTLADAPAAGEAFAGGLLAATEARLGDAGAPAALLKTYGAVSAEAAEAMARAARARFGSDWGAGLTGAPDEEPRGGEPPGTMYGAVVGPDGRARSLKTQMSQGRAATRRRAVTATLMLLHRAIREESRDMDNAEIVRNFCAEWDAPAPDGERLAAYFTEDAFYHNIPMEPITGRANIVAALTGMGGAMVSKGWDVLALAAEGDTVMTERIDKFDAGGNAVALPVMGVFELRDGRIASWRDYFDLATFQKQMAGG